ncbi:MFS transporter [Virgibacillus oceani]|uniref:MFS transporter n=1 Tax=Virgibacillus oceani TaxID=1479511 RepID=A0A917M1L9_9BACI|nr:MFS transporter [Virgibacillus oceani]GGG72153.1 MFS transporter [Virgibacillus oceani]
MKNNASIWRDLNFIKFFSANALSNLGNWFDFVAVLILFRYTWEASPMLIALIPVMYAIPSILLGQFAGVFADRRNKLKILIHSDWLRAGLTFLLVFTPAPLLALPVLLLRNTVGVISLPAQQGLMRSIVDEEDILKAVTINGSLFQLVKVIGPLIGGSVAGVFSPDISIVVNAFSFVISGVILTRIHLKNQVSEKKEESNKTEQSGFFASWKEGWSIVLRSRILLASIIFGVVSTLTIQMIDAQIVTLFSEVFPKRAELTGWAISAVGIGSLIVVLFLNRLNQIRKYGWFFGTGSLLIGVMTGGFGFLGDYSFIILAIGLALIGGIGNGITFTAVNYLIQKEPPIEAIGRVSGIVDSTLSILFIAGPLLGGLLINQLGVLAAFRIIGIGLSLVGTAGILFQKLIWKQNKQAVAQEEGKRDCEIVF